MDTLIASTQYTDMRGTVAVDEAHDKDITSYLRLRNLLSSDEHVVGVAFYYEESWVFFRVLVANHNDYRLIAEAAKKSEQIQPSSLRKISLELDLNTFFEFFKRFDVKMVQAGLTGALDEVNIDNLPD